jgi:hypothetical protein
MARVSSVLHTLSWPSTGLSAGDEGAMRSGYTADLTVAHGILESNIVVIEKPFTQERCTRKLPVFLTEDAWLKQRQRTSVQQSSCIVLALV